MPWIKEKIFDLVSDTVAPYLKQLAVYMNTPAVQSAALDIVNGLVDGKTKIIIGHSLGSIVAFDYVTNVLPKRGLTLPLLITLGSPLGDKTLVWDRLQPRPPVYPSSVTRWVNISAKDDPVAANPNLALDYPDESDAGQLDSGWIVFNEGQDKHAIADYLNQKVVGSYVANAFDERADIVLPEGAGQQPEAAPLQASGS